jgi:uncharacterized protein DUF3105
VSSRQEEKQRRREEREAAERAAAATAQRTRRLQLVGGSILVLAVIVVAVVLIAGSGGGSGSETTSNAVGAPIPAAGPDAKADALPAAAKAAGCVARTFPSEGRNHVTSPVKYKTNPPTSGNHNPTPAEDGIYTAANTPAKEHFVHTLEHGRIEIQYKKGTPSQTVKQLESLFTSLDDGYHMLLFENTTNMPYAVAATAWGHSLSCPTMNDKVFDAIRTFRTAHINKGPETVP